MIGRRAGGGRRRGPGTWEAKGGFRDQGTGRRSGKAEEGVTGARGLQNLLLDIIFSNPYNFMISQQTQDIHTTLCFGYTYIYM